MYTSNELKTECKIDSEIKIVIEEDPIKELPLGRSGICLSINARR